MDYQSLRDVEIRINENYKCIQELEKLISLLNTDEEKLELISFIGRLYADYVTGQYASDILEQNVIEIGKKITFSSSEKFEDGQILIVMTMAGSVGGHTVLVHNWIKWDDENQYSVVFTNMQEECTPDFIREAVRESGGDILCLSGSILEKADRLLRISQKFERILLFTNMEDVIPVLAYSNEKWRIPVYFYNHADFRFSYGFSVADSVLNLCEFDVDKTERYRGIESDINVYLQFPGENMIEKRREKIDKKIIRKKMEEKYGIRENEKIVVSMGMDFKYGNVIDYDFDIYVKQLIEQSNIELRFLIIGADKNKRKWLRLKEETKGKALALGVLPRNEAEQIISGADLYIVSFPMMASGRREAENAGVPSLCLDIIGRYYESDDIRSATSVEELIEKSIDVLKGKGNKYLKTSSCKEWKKQKWKFEWQKIYKSFNVHAVHTFHPKRCIEKQEYINCQLMQDYASQMIYDHIKYRLLNEQVKELLYYLDRKYDMGISYLYLDDLQEECESLKHQLDYCNQLSKKHLQLYLTAIKWIGVKQKGKKIDEILYCQGYRSVAIYGMSYMGQVLLDELSGGLLEVLYGIDKNASELCARIPILRPSDKLEKVDIILNTTIIENSELIKAIGMESVKMINLNQLFSLLSDETN